MKYSAVITLCCIVFGCGGLKYIPPTETYLGNDFTSHSERGFLFTPLDYSGDYDSIALLTLRATPEGEKEFGVWFFGKVDTDSLLEKVYNQAIEMGADAMVNVRLLKTRIWFRALLPLYM